MHALVGWRIILKFRLAFLVLCEWGVWGLCHVCCGWWWCSWQGVEAGVGQWLLHLPINASLHPPLLKSANFTSWFPTPTDVIARIKTWEWLAPGLFINLLNHTVSPANSRWLLGLFGCSKPSPVSIAGSVTTPAWLPAQGHPVNKCLIFGFSCSPETIAMRNDLPYLIHLVCCSRPRECRDHCMSQSSHGGEVSLACFP